MEDLRKRFSELSKKSEGLDAVWDREELSKINKEMREILDKIISSFGKRG